MYILYKFNYVYNKRNIKSSEIYFWRSKISNLLINN